MTCKQEGATHHNACDCREDHFRSLQSELAAVKKEFEERGHQFQKSMNDLLVELKEAKRLGDELAHWATNAELLSERDGLKRKPILAAWEEFRGRAK